MIGSDGEATPRETKGDDDEDDDKRDENGDAGSDDAENRCRG